MKIPVIIVSLFVLTACTANVCPPAAKLTITPPPAIPAPSLEHVKFQAVRVGNHTLYALDENNVTILFNNIIDTKKYISQEQNMIRFYQQQLNK
ncbi:hypothetical protein [Gluconacetobacter diazotrophicus]|uniref:hypothetical protein n=1 Tax=Gluconacetobacter diazotrophicus TaxID=33996 RepID=UPI0011A3D662|nr:hypothetical protein [Gluconacetobacter diazotrophicus]